MAKFIIIVFIALITFVSTTPIKKDNLFSTIKNGTQSAIIPNGEDEVFHFLQIPSLDFGGSPYNSIDFNVATTSNRRDEPIIEMDDKETIEKPRVFV